MKISDILHTIGGVGILVILAIAGHLENQGLLALSFAPTTASAVVGLAFACGLISFWYIFQDKIGKEFSFAMYLFLIGSMIFWFVAMPIAARVFRDRRRRRPEADKARTA